MAVCAATPLKLNLPYLAQALIASFLMKNWSIPTLEKIQIFPSLLLILLGSMDCLTTVIGTRFFGAVELNPLIADLVGSNHRH
jgi:hypothetical protein